MQFISRFERDQTTTIVRLATLLDVPFLVKQRYMFRGAYNSNTSNFEAENEFLRRCADWMRKRLEQRNSWVCLISEQDGLIIGQIWIQFIDKTPNPVLENEPSAYITNFYVTKEARRMGIGAILFEAALNRCRNENSRFDYIVNDG